MAISLAAVGQSPKSVTVWLGAAVAAVGMIQVNVQAFAPIADPAVLEGWLKMLNVILGVAVVFNRFYTDGSLEAKAAPPAP